MKWMSFTEAKDKYITRSRGLKWVHRIGRDFNLIETMTSYSMVVTVMLAVVLLAARDTFAVEHKVGGALGWNYPPNQGAEYFANWAAQNAFHVGDSLCKNPKPAPHGFPAHLSNDFAACVLCSSPKKFPVVDTA